MLAELTFKQLKNIFKNPFGVIFWAIFKVYWIITKVSDGEEEAKENGGEKGGAEAKPAKISSSLFRKRKGGGTDKDKEREAVEAAAAAAGDDISVDADFFNQKVVH